MLMLCICRIIISPKYGVLEQQNRCKSNKNCTEACGRGGYSEKWNFMVQFVDGYGMEKRHCRVPQRHIYTYSRVFQSLLSSDMAL